jgi:hypothetical protein
LATVDENTILVTRMRSLDSQDDGENAWILARISRLQQLSDPPLLILCHPASGGVCMAMCWLLISMPAAG